MYIVRRTEDAKTSAYLNAINTYRACLFAETGTLRPIGRRIASSDNQRTICGCLTGNLDVDCDWFWISIWAERVDLVFFVGFDRITRRNSICEGIYILEEG
jgi:hypothetical protein